MKTLRAAVLVLGPAALAVVGVFAARSFVRSRSRSDTKPVDALRESSAHEPDAEVIAFAETMAADGHATVVVEEITPTADGELDLIETVLIVEPS